MANLTNRVVKLEQAAAANTPPAVGHAAYWQALRKVYGDGKDYTAEELAAHDTIDPAQYAWVLEKVYAERAERAAKKKADESTDKSG